MRFHISSSKRPTLIGMRRTWNAFVPDQRVGDVLLHVRVHPLDDGDHRHEKRDGHDDAEQREEERSLLARISVSAVRRTSSGSMGRREGGLRMWGAARWEATHRRVRRGRQVDSFRE